MKISEFKSALELSKNIHFSLENGDSVPAHFHITEVGVVNKHYIDCGGTVRKEKFISFQLWTANDLDHRLAPQKVLDIIDASKGIIGDDDLPIEVEFQQDTIGRYDVEATSNGFLLKNKKTQCLAEDACGIPPKKKIRLSVIQNNSCDPNSGCC